jgi:AcrR family transcriptional regulator
LSPVPEPVVPSAKAEQTRQSIVEAALRLFHSGGYDKTTMRAIAREAGVSLGGAYYYFDSKEHLIQAYYDRVQEQHAAAAVDVLQDTSAFPDRLRGVLLAWVDVSTDYHEFSGKFFKNAAEPSSPLSPFSADSTAAREASIKIYREVVEGSDLKLAKSLRMELPELLWLLQMGVVLFWVYDASPGQQRTRQLIDGAVPMIDKLVRLSRLPLVRGVVDDLITLIGTLKGR